MLKKLETTPQSPVHHPEGNVWNHTLLVVDEAAGRKSESGDPRVFMWAALLHDIGKPATTRVRKGRITAYEHDRVGAELTREFLAALTDDMVFTDKVVSLVKYHMQALYVTNDLPFQDIAGMIKNTDIREVALLCLCDRLGRTGASRREEERQIRLFLDRVGRSGINKETREVMMAKAGMRRPDPEAPHGESRQRNHFRKNDVKPVEELQGKAKFTKEKAKPIIYDAPERSNRSD